VPERRGALFSFFQDERTPKCVADGGSAVALSTGTTPPSGNPGKFVVHKEVDGRYAVIGISRKDETGKDESVNAPLETPISITRQQRDATATLPNRGYALRENWREGQVRHDRSVQRPFT
jgi:hypothetical protein